MDLINGLITLQCSFSATIAEQIWGTNMGRHLNKKWNDARGNQLTPMGADILFFITSLDAQNKQLLAKYLHDNIVA
jgi:hypothetical protein